MDGSVVQLEKLFDLSRRVVEERSETGLLQRVADAAREMTDSQVAVAGHGYSEGVFRYSVTSAAPGLGGSSTASLCRMEACNVQFDLLNRSQTLRLTERELRERIALQDLPAGHPTVRGLLGARLLGPNGAPAGILIVSDKGAGDYTRDDEVLIAHLSTLASAYLPNLFERHMSEVREAEAVERTKRLATRLHQRSERLARLEERHRIAQALHDSVSQSLYSISLSATAANTMLARDPHRAAGMIEFVLAQSRAAVTEMRSLVYELRSNALAAEGIHIAFMRMAEAFEARWNLRVSLDIACEPSATLEAKEAIYRIGQEALRNTARHASAGSAVIRIRCGDDHVVVEAEDDGVGFDPDVPLEGRSGIVLMRSQALRLGGTCEIQSTPGGGTRVRATLPVRKVHTR